MVKPTTFHPVNFAGGGWATREKRRRVEGGGGMTAAGWVMETSENILARTTWGEKFIGKAAMNGLVCSDRGPITYFSSVGTNWHVNISARNSKASSAFAIGPRIRRCIRKRIGTALWVIPEKKKVFLQSVFLFASAKCVNLNSCAISQNQIYMYMAKGGKRGLKIYATRLAVSYLRDQWTIP